MTNYVFTRLEVRGKNDALSPFHNPWGADGELEIEGSPSGLESMREDWRDGLRIRTTDAAVVYNWTSVTPDRILESLASYYPELIFVASMTDEVESFIGTWVYMGDTLACSCRDIPIAIHNPPPTITRDGFSEHIARLFNLYSYLEYCEALSKVGLQPLPSTAPGKGGEL